MRVTTATTDAAVGFDGLRAVVGAGEGVVGRFPGIVCVARCADPEPLRELLAVCAAVAGPDPGLTLARRLATWMSGPAAPGPELRFGTVAAVGEQLAVYLVGAVDARIDAVGGLVLSGAHAAVGTDRLLPRPSTPIVLSIDGGAVRGDPADVHDLRAGVVPGAGVVLHPADFEAGSSLAAAAGERGHEWFDTGRQEREAFAGPEWRPDVPAQRAGGHNGSARSAVDDDVDEGAWPADTRPSPPAGAAATEATGVGEPEAVPAAGPEGLGAEAVGVGRPGDVGPARPDIVGAAKPEGFGARGPDIVGAARQKDVGGPGPEVVGVAGPEAVGALRPGVAGATGMEAVGAAGPEAVGAVRPEAVGPGVARAPELRAAGVPGHEAVGVPWPSQIVGGPPSDAVGGLGPDAVSVSRPGAAGVPGPQVVDITVQEPAGEPGAAGVAWSDDDVGVARSGPASTGDRAAPTDRDPLADSLAGEALADARSIAATDGDSALRTDPADRGLGDPLSAPLADAQATGVAAVSADPLGPYAATPPPPRAVEPAAGDALLGGPEPGPPAATADLHSSAGPRAPGSFDAFSDTPADPVGDSLAGASAGSLSGDSRAGPPVVPAANQQVGDPLGADPLAGPVAGASSVDLSGVDPPDRELPADDLDGTAHTGRHALGAPPPDLFGPAPAAATAPPAPPTGDLAFVERSLADPDPRPWTADPLSRPASTGSALGGMTSSAPGESSTSGSASSGSTSTGRAPIGSVPSGSLPIEGPVGAGAGPAPIAHPTAGLFDSDLFAPGPASDLPVRSPTARAAQERPSAPGTDLFAAPPERRATTAVEATSTMPGLLFVPAADPATGSATVPAVPETTVQPAAPEPAAHPPADETATSRGRARIRGYRCENGHLNDPRSSSCRHCGAPIDERVGGLVAGPRPPLGRLLFDDGAAHVVDGGYLVGRMPEVDERVRTGELRPIIVEDRAGSVSRVHAEVRVSGWDVMVVDTGSRNGTYVSGPDEGQWTALPPRRSRRLLPGTRVRLGARTFVFESASTVR